MRLAHKRQESRQRIGRAKLLHLGKALDHISDKVTASIVDCLRQGSHLVFSIQRGDTGSVRKEFGSLLHGVRPFGVLCRLRELFPMIQNA